MGVEASACSNSLKAGPQRHTGWRWQIPRRSLERAVRVRSVAFDRWARRRGLSPQQIAGVLQLAPRTLRHWKQQWQKQRLATLPRGRPAARSTRPQRSAVLDLLRTAGPAVSLEVLRAQFPQMRAAELKRLLRRYRKQRRRQREARPQGLYWFLVGSVWAMDFVEQLGGLSWVFSVRDLASRQQLLWRSVPSPSAEVVIAALRELFREHGPPLVLKSDNGSGFIAAAMLDFLAEHGVIPLFSPARRPQYNGGCERGGGILKGYTCQVALNAGRPGVCLDRDLEQARQLANALTRPWGHHGPSPEDVWRARPRLSAGHRQAFQDELGICRSAACQLLEYPLDEPLSRTQTARRDRRAVQAVLEAQGYLARVGRRDPLLRRPPACVPALASVAGIVAVKNSSLLPAPRLEKPCTLNSGPVASVGSGPEVQRSASAHGESAMIRVLRRSITPLVKLLKAASNP
jgi:transposase InsO family protein